MAVFHEGKGILFLAGENQTDQQTIVRLWLKDDGSSGRVFAFMVSYMNICINDMLPTESRYSGKMTRIRKWNPRE